MRRMARKREHGSPRPYRSTPSAVVPGPGASPLSRRWRSLRGPAIPRSPGCGQSGRDEKASARERPPSKVGPTVQRGGWLQPFAELTKRPGGGPKCAKEQSKKKRGEYSPRPQAGIHHVHAPGRTGVDGPGTTHANAIPHRRLIDNFFDSTVEKL